MDVIEKEPSLDAGIQEMSVSHDSPLSRPIGLKPEVSDGIECSDSLTVGLTIIKEEIIEKIDIFKEENSPGRYTCLTSPLNIHSVTEIKEEKVIESISCKVMKHETKEELLDIPMIHGELTDELTVEEHKVDVDSFFSLPLDSETNVRVEENINSHISNREEGIKICMKREGVNNYYTVVYTNKCKVCNKRFRTNFLLDRHFRTHTGEKPFRCSYCSRTFSHRESLKNHVRTHTGEKPYTCEYCSKAFAQRGGLICHIRIHTGEKPFTCVVCKKSFSEVNGLKMHSRIHTGEKRYKCDLCSKTFLQTGHLSVHKRVHIGLKPYACKLCNKFFREKHEVTKHMVIHSGVKKYKCNVCSKRFSRKTTMSEHVFKHTGEKPFSCNCGKSFSCKSGLRKHKLCHTGEKRFSCDVCKKNFTAKSSLGKHCAKHNVGFFKAMLGARSVDVMPEGA